VPVPLEGQDVRQSELRQSVVADTAVVEAFVVESPPENVSLVVVASDGNG
jgi:hypothetical protein